MSAKKEVPPDDIPWEQSPESKYLVAMVVVMLLIGGWYLSGGIAVSEVAVAKKVAAAGYVDAIIHPAQPNFLFGSPCRSIDTARRAIVAHTKTGEEVTIVACGRFFTSLSIRQP